MQRGQTNLNDPSFLIKITHGKPFVESEDYERKKFKEKKDLCHEKDTFPDVIDFRIE